MKLKTLSSVLTLVLCSGAYAQDSVNKSFLIYGSVDTYYKYDINKQPNIATSFNNDHNSISLGMIDFGIKKTTGKASFVGEVSFGPRGQYQSLVSGDGSLGNGDNSFFIQNLNVTYALTEKLALTAGFMGTFVGYEIISPTGNFNYSTSYLFSAGPFQNAGIKGTYAITPRISLMAGLFDDWNVYKDLNGVSHFGAQLGITPIDGWTAYFNVLTGKNHGGVANGALLDVTTSYQISGKVKMAINAADYHLAEGQGGYRGAALYLQNAFSDKFALGVRTEYFETKAVGLVQGEGIRSVTFSGNFKAGGLTFIPEFRIDDRDDSLFKKSDFTPTGRTSQYSLAAVYSFE
ncbi:outer membrane beta-barrel protein [Pedobacter sp.]|uniref:outer membrane beta-barrel protein n=1 Tax=Pedobacter sp. TaxID=1411316 RepID=UPI003D7F60AF